MTFSFLGRCPRTGEFGAISATSTVAIGSRVTHAEAGLGVILTQHRTDPRLGPRGLALLRSGCTAQETVDALVASTPHRAWRQVAVLDADGNSAAYSGANTTSEMAHVPAQDACAVGNHLANVHVGPAMMEAFFADPLPPLAERLVRTLEAGLAVGGSSRPSRSACLLVMAGHSFPLVDLRVDWDEAPVAALRSLWERYAPLTQDYVLRAITPDTAPAH